MATKRCRDCPVAFVLDDPRQILCASGFAGQGEPNGHRPRQENEFIELTNGVGTGFIEVLPPKPAVRKLSP